ncbi:O-antigen ligase family protein [Novipirellula rosea]|uniref:O-antigen ligase family protein n=1 Tax=Novipirellula rosea TaxID=1031540 RepID=A0ABP8NS60_9BACT
MKSIAPLLTQISLWASACILTVLPCAIAFDYGGILPWAQWATCVAVLAAGLLALPSIIDRETLGGPRFHWLAILLLGWAAFAWFQTLPLPGFLTSLLSPGSAAAYTTWLDPILGSQTERSSMHPISIDPAASRHAIAMLLVVATLAWTSASVFQNRRRLVLLMAGLAVGAAVHAALGIFQLVSPETDLLGMNAINRGSHFAAFVNRNNAALMMNIGVGASMGVLAWRLSALIGTEVDDENFEVNDLISLASDRDSSIALISLVLCTAALLVCGSRGGLVSAMIGFTLALGWIRARRGTASIPVIIAVLAIAVALLIVPFNLDLTSLDRMELLSDQDQSTLLNDGRIPLWNDVIAAATTYLPTGSGLGTFADAHLTQLEKSSDGWAHHADNLWLEMFTEQGIPGLLFVGVLIVGVIRSLNKLNDSPDAVDHGLRVAGWYILGSLAVSQFFDMGLIIPANLIACAIFLPVAATRGHLVAPRIRDTGYQSGETDDYFDADEYIDADDEHEVAEDLADEQTVSGELDGSGDDGVPIESVTATEAKRKPRIRFQTKKSLFPSLAIAALVVLPNAWALSVLQKDASADAIIRRSQAMLAQRGVEPAQLETLISPLEELAKQTASPAVYRTLSDLHFQLARYDEVVQANPKSTEQLRELYQQTAPAVRRLKWHAQNESVAARSTNHRSSSSGSDSNDSADTGGDTSGVERTATPPLSRHYIAALKNAEAELCVRPLSREARTASLYLDFVYTDRDRTRAILQQLSELYGTYSAALRQLAQLSLDSNESELGATYLRKLLERQPNQTPAALKMLESHPDILIASIVPPTTANYRAAAKYLITRPDPDLEFLARAFEGLACGQSETIAERARCEELCADTAYVLKRHIESFECYQKAVELDSANANLQLKYINRLREQDKIGTARALARKARERFPDDRRFDAVINQMAQQELR